MNDKEETVRKEKDLDLDLDKEVKKKKKGKWKVVVGVIVALGIIGALTNGGEGDKDKDKEVADEKPVEEVVADESDDELVADEGSDDELGLSNSEDGADEDHNVVAQKVLENSIVAELKKQFGEDSVKFDEESKSFSITLPEEVALELVLMQQGSIGTEDWEYLRDNVIKLSTTIQEVLGDGYIISLINPMNTEKTLLTVADGVVFYDVFGDSVFN